jgi:hypothetical protein
MAGMLLQNAHAVFETIATAHRQLLENYRPDDAIQLMDAMPPTIEFDTYTKQVEDYWAEIARDLGEGELDAFQRLTLLRLIETYGERAEASGHVYTPLVVSEFNRHFQRIIRSAQDPTPGAYETHGYFFRIDLALCRQKALPVGFAVVDLHQAFPRGLAFRGGVRQFFQVLWFAVRYGHTNYYEAHLHPVDRNYMTKENFHRHQLMVVDLLSANPQMKGYFGKGFFNDPQIHRVSPNLGYIRENQPGCGHFFYLIQDPDEGALVSKTRRELYERGDYVPKVYYGVWPRRAAMRWVGQFRATHPDFDPTPNYAETRDQPD